MFQPSLSNRQAKNYKIQNLQLVVPWGVTLQQYKQQSFISKGEAFDCSQRPFNAILGKLICMKAIVISRAAQVLGDIFVS